jgi:hypothetical protein
MEYIWPWLKVEGADSVAFVSSVCTSYRTASAGLMRRHCTKV